MPLVLGPRSSRCLLAVLALAAFIYLYLCTRVYRSAESAKVGTVAGQLQATQLQPANALYWRQLGDIELYEERNPEKAFAGFHRAVQLNPRDADGWIGAAYTLQLLAKPDEERVAIAHAVAASPHRLEIIWQAANLHASLGDTDAVRWDTCLLLAHDPRRGQDALELARRSRVANAPLDCYLTEEAR